LLKGPARFIPSAGGVKLNFGGLLSVLRPLKARWDVETPDAVAAVRGTEFYIEARPGKGTYLCLCRGALDVFPAGEPLAQATSLAAKKHKSLSYRTEKGKLVSSSAMMAHHSDGEIASLRKLLDRKE